MPTPSPRQSVFKTNISSTETARKWAVFYCLCLSCLWYYYSMSKRKTVNWIEDATANSHGQFSAKAKKARMSTRKFAKKMENATGRTGKQARLAETLMGLHKGN